jgi:hypothetical protein
MFVLVFNLQKTLPICSPSTGMVYNGNSLWMCDEITNTGYMYFGVRTLLTDE